MQKCYTDFLEKKKIIENSLEWIVNVKVQNVGKSCNNDCILVNTKLNAEAARIL